MSRQKSLQAYCRNPSTIAQGAASALSGKRSRHYAACSERRVPAVNRPRGALAL
jgi:hypothetical protein